jgi:predicted dehydrogenase
MDIVVVGCGSIGRRHIGNFKSLKTVGTVRAVDSNPERLKMVTEKFPGVETYTNYEEALDKGFCGVAVCTPPHIHTQLALTAVKRGCPVFIEKPFAMTAEGVDALLTLADEKNIPVMTAYCFRFWPPLLKMKELLDGGKIGKPLASRAEYASFLPEWHPWEDYRTFYMAKKAQGGGAILDESHAIDFTQWLMGEVDTVACFNDQISSLEIDSDDIAEIIIRFKSGAIGSVHLDLLARAPQGLFRIEGEEGVLEWDRYKNEVRLYQASAKKWETFSFKNEAAEMYVREAEHFVECASKKTKPVIDGWEGYKTLKIVLASIQSSQEQRMVKLAPVGKTAVALS